MQPEESDPAYLWDMLEAARAVMRFTVNLSLPKFLTEGNETVRLAVERKLEILGEAGRRVSPGFRDGHPEIPWKEIIGLRNVISHQYDKVNYQEIYGIARKRVPELIERLASLVPPPPEIEE